MLLRLFVHKRRWIFVWAETRIVLERWWWRFSRIDSVKSVLNDLRVVYVMNRRESQGFVKIFRLTAVSVSQFLCIFKFCTQNMCQFRRKNEFTLEIRSCWFFHHIYAATGETAIRNNPALPYSPVLVECVVSPLNKAYSRVAKREFITQCLGYDDSQREKVIWITDNN